MTRTMRVLVLIQGPLGDRLTGPEIRGWEVARAFAARHEVTAAASVASPHVREGITVVPRTRRRILSEVMRHDVVIGPVIPPYALMTLSGRRCLRVADLYDPVELELGHRRRLARAPCHGAAAGRAATASALGRRRRERQRATARTQSPARCRRRSP